MQQNPLFVSGIGTDVGKTIVSALLCEYLKCDYWKPVQAGDLDNTDSHKISRLISNPYTTIHPEQFRLQLAASPHQAAQAENLNILSSDFKLPDSDKQLLIEGAGGLCVPLSPSLLIADLISQFNAEVVLVIRNYLGCINHTLTSLQTLYCMDIPLKLLMFNGAFHPETKAAILDRLPSGCSWMQIPELPDFRKKTIKETASQLIFNQ